MAKKTISNTFTVNTIIDGESAPYYFQEWFAWSNDASTVNVTTSPTISGSWETSIPAQGSYAYLWRKSIRFVWNESTRQYTQESAQYFRMSGTNGTSITPKGNAVAYTDQSAAVVDPYPTDGDIVLYTKSHGGDNYDKYVIYDWSTMTGGWEGYNANDGDSYVLPNGHLMMFSTETDDWLDLGQFQGESGKTYYTHIAWATNVVYSGGRVTSVEGFVTTKSPNDTTHVWMGVLIDEIAGQDSTKATEYAWSYTKGVQGDAGNDAVQYYIKTDIDNVVVPSNQQSIDLSYTPKAYFKKITGSEEAAQTMYYATYWRSGSALTSRSSGQASQINLATTYNSIYDSLVIFAKVASAPTTTDFDCKKEIIIQKRGNTGARGKIGRFFYFGGVFDSSNTNTSFVVNDAQAPYFEHTVDGQKRYHVFNYDTNGSYTMAQMWSISNQSWSNTPWEVMTNDFKYIITEALFGAYAHLGSFIINGDWMISQHGTINGQASTNYTQFDPDHPNDNTGTNFIPYFAVDGLTGKSYQNDAYVNGTIVSGGSGESKWEISPKAQGIYQIPTIIGYDTQGNKKIQLIYDGDASDTYQVSYGGGLSFIEQEAGAGDLTVAGYFKTTWINSNSDNYNSSYIRATSDPSEPRIEFQSTVNSGKYLKVGVDTSGVLLYSTNWPAYNSNFSNGRVYIDANGYLRVKGNATNMPEGVNPSCVCTLRRVSTNTTLDRIYDTIIATRQGITLTLPSDAVNGQKYTIIPKTSCVLSCGNTSHRLRFGDDTVTSVSIVGPKAHYLIFDAVDKYWYISWGAA